MTLIEAKVLVDEEQVGELYRFAAELRGRRGKASGPADLSWVQEAYRGGNSQVWRPMLDYLAERADQEVPWPDICVAVERTPDRMSGALGAAERRINNTGLPLPYSKRWKQDVRYFTMPADVARAVRELNT